MHRVAQFSLICVLASASCFADTLPDLGGTAQTTAGASTSTSTSTGDPTGSTSGGPTTDATVTAAPTTSTTGTTSTGDATTTTTIGTAPVTDTTSSSSTTGGGPACAELLHASSFDDALDAAWQNLDGEWSWSPGTYTSPSIEGWATTWIGPHNWPNYRVRTRLRFLENPSIGGVMVRMSADGNQWFGFFAAVDPGGKLLLGTIENGIENKVDQPIKPIEIGAWHDLEVIADGDLLSVSLDGMILLDAAPGLIADTGSVGLIAAGWEVSYDEFVVCGL